MKKVIVFLLIMMPLFYQATASFYDYNDPMFNNSGDEPTFPPFDDSMFTDDPNFDYKSTPESDNPEQNGKKADQSKKIDPELLENIEHFLKYSKELEQEVNSTADNNLFYASEREELAPLFKKCDEVRTILSNFGKSSSHHGKTLYLEALLLPEFEKARTTLNRISPHLKKLLTRIKIIQTIKTKSEQNQEQEESEELNQAAHDRREILDELSTLAEEDQKKESSLSFLAIKLTEVMQSKPAKEQITKFLKAKQEAEKKITQAQQGYKGYGNYEYYTPSYESKYGRGNSSYYNGYLDDYGSYSNSYGNGYSGGGWDNNSYGNYGSYDNGSNFDNKFNSQNKSSEDSNTQEKSDPIKTSIITKNEPANSLANKIINHELMKTMIQLATQHAVNDEYVKKLTALYEHENFKMFIEGMTKLIKKISNLEDPTSASSEEDDDSESDTESKKNSTKKAKELSPGQKEFLKRLKVIIPVIIHLKLHPDQVVAASGLTEYKLPFATEGSNNDEESSVKTLYGKVNELIEAINHHAEIKDTDKMKAQYKAVQPKKQKSETIETEKKESESDETKETNKPKDKPKPQVKPLKRLHFSDRIEKKNTPIAPVKKQKRKKIIEDE